MVRSPRLVPGKLPRRPRVPFAIVPRRVRWLIYLISPGAFAFGYLLVLISAYFPEVGISSASVGLILGANGAAMVASAVPLGMLSDRRGRKGLLLAGAAVLPASLLVFALTTDVTLLVLASIASGVADGAFLASWNAIIADQTTVEERDSAFALSFVLGNVTSGLGLALPFAFPWIEAWTRLDTHTVHQGAMVVLALASVASPAGLWLLLRDYKETVRPRTTRTKAKDLGPLLKFSGINGLIGLGAGFIIPLMATWFLLRFGVPDSQSGPLLAVANLTIGLAGVASAGLSRRFGQVPAIVMTQALSTAFMISMVPAPTAFLAGGLYVVRAGLMNMAVPLLDSFLMGLVPADQRGLASAVNSLVWRLPNSITTVLGGIILASGDYNLPLYLATGFYLVAIALFYATFRKVAPRG